MLPPRALGLLLLLGLAVVLTAGEIPPERTAIFKQRPGLPHAGRPQPSAGVKPLTGVRPMTKPLFKPQPLPIIKTGRPDMPPLTGVRPQTKPFFKPQPLPIIKTGRPDMPPLTGVRPQTKPFFKPKPLPSIRPGRLDMKPLTGVRPQTKPFFKPKPLPSIRPGRLDMKPLTGVRPQTKPFFKPQELPMIKTGRPDMKPLTGVRPQTKPFFKPQPLPSIRPGRLDMKPLTGVRPQTLPAILPTKAEGATYHPAVKCGDNSIEVLVERARLAKLDRLASRLLAGGDTTNPHCRPTITKDTLTFKYPLDECNPHITETKDEVRYGFEMRLQRPRSARAITRSHHIALDVSCRYARNAVVEATYQGDVALVRYMGSSRGTFDFGMSLYGSAGISTTARLARGAEVEVGTAVFALIEFRSTANLNMYVRNCYAQPQQTGAGRKYTFIQDGCFGPDQTFSPVTSHINGKSYAFRFDAFKFVHAGTSNVFLTCDLYLCRPETQGGKCTLPRKCGKGGDHKRDLSKLEAVQYPVTFGPLKVHQ